MYIQHMLMTFGLVATFTLTASADAAPLTPTTPVTVSIEVKCYFFEGQRQTVDIAMDKTRLWLPNDLFHFSFRNTQTGQSTDYLRGTQEDPQRFPIPAGNYTLTISYATASAGINPRHNQTVVRNLTVPYAISTGGKGSGCKFLPYTEQR